MIRDPGFGGWEPDLLAAVEKYCNGDIGADEFADLESRLLADSTARARFRAYMNVDAGLRDYAAPADLPTGSRGRVRAAWIGVAIAAGLMIGVAGTWSVIGRGAKEAVDRHPPGSIPGPPAAVLDLATVLAVEAVEWATGATTRPGVYDPARAGSRLAISGGRLSLGFINGVVVHLEGPTDVDLIAPNQITCRRGRVRVRVPAGVAGFRVECPGCTIVDLGTEFGVTVDPDGRVRVMVFEGRVDVSAAGRTRPLSRNDAVEVNFTANGFVAVPPDPTAFAAPLPVSAGPPLELSSGYPDQVRVSRPKGYWRFERADGDRFPDDAGGPAMVRSPQVKVRPEGRGNHSVEFASGDAGQYLALDGLWQPATGGGHAIECWAMSEGPGVSSLVGLLVDLPNNQGEGHLAYLEAIPHARGAGDEPGGVRFLERWPPGPGGGVSLGADRVCRPGRWHHLVGQRRGDRAELFVDGTLVAEAALAPGAGTAPAHVLVGRLHLAQKVSAAVQRPFVGRFDELALYDHPLSHDEIRSHSQSSGIRP